MSSFGPFAMRLLLAIFLFFTVYQSMIDENRVLERNTNESLVYYTKKFQPVYDFQQKHPLLSARFDSLIINGMSLFAIIGGLFLLVGSKNYGGLFALFHSILMITFCNNTWTPKVNSDVAMRNMVVSLIEMSAALSIMFRVHPADFNEQVAASYKVKS